MFKYFIILRFWPDNEMIELVCGMPAPQLGSNLRECEDQSWIR
jgi:hypothetical protein